MTALKDLLRKYSAALRSLHVSQVWFGYGSAIFIDFGALTPTLRRDGSPGNGTGEMTISIEYSWRLETGHAISFGSDDDKETWAQTRKELLGRQVIELSVFGRLPEISASFAGGLSLSSFTPCKGQPDWAVFDNRAPTTKWLHVEGGQLVETFSDRVKSN